MLDNYEDLIIAAMETGNHERARMFYHEYKEVDSCSAATLYSQIVKDYSVFL